MNKLEFTIPSHNAALYARAVVPAMPRRTAGGAIGVVVLSHGLLDSVDAPLFGWLQQALSQQGLASVAFDFHGNGRSSGQTGYANYYSEVEDIRAVIEHINGRGIPGVTRPCLVVSAVGHSKGASSMLLFGFKYAHLCPPLLVALSARFWLARELTVRCTESNHQDLAKNGRFLWRKYGTRPSTTGGGSLPGEALTAEAKPKEYWVTLDDINVRSDTDMTVVQALPLHRCFVLNVTGSRDQVVPGDDTWEYDRLIRNAAPTADRVTTRVVPGASHFWRTRQELNGLGRVLLPWLAQMLPRVGFV